MKINLSLATTTLAGIVFAVGLTGCGAKGQQFTEFKKPDANKGMVYVYRPSSFVGGGMYYDVHDKNDNNKVIGTLKNGGYIAKQMEPGKNVLWAKTEVTREVTVTVKENDFVCVRGKVGFGIVIGRPSLVNVNKETCEKEIKETKAIIEDKTTPNPS